MSTQPLSRSSLPTGALIGAPAPAATGIVHLGLGSFHRAHGAVDTALALAAGGGDWGILGVANRSRRIVEGLRAQDHLYSVLELTPHGQRTGVVDVHRGTLVAADDPDGVLAAVADPAHRIVTLTIWEKGYHRSAVTGRLDVDDPQLAGELAVGRPRTLLGQLAVGLWHRALTSQAPVTVLSCDNMQSAGTTTAAMVHEYLIAAGAPDTVLDAVAATVTFPNAMVDRIVPATTDATRSAVERLLGVHDEIPVPAEQFSMWVLEDRFAAGRPAWEAAGVIFTDEVERYELVKLRLLNGCHSLIAYLGALDGRATIPEARAQDVVADCVAAAIDDEYLPSIELPTGFDAPAYVAQLFDRWSNTALADATARVGSDGSNKLLQRVPEPALRLLHQGRTPHQLALTVAAWIACVVPPAGFDPGPIAAQMDEPRRADLARATAGTTTLAAHVEAIMTGGFFPTALAEQRRFTDRVTELLDTVVRHGVRTAAADALASRDPLTAAGTTATTRQDAAHR